MGSNERRFDEFLDAHRRGDEAALARLLDEDAGLRRLAQLRDGARAVPEAPPAEAGLPFERLGDYRLLHRLGEGGMGQLFLAHQESLGRTVALKLIQTALLGSPTARERFRREALAAARLQHPNLVTVYAAGEEEGVSYIAMEHIAGRGLDELLRASRSGKDPLDVPRVVRWGARLARALAYAHDRGVLHRDVKPSNILVTPDDAPVLIDFGVARDARWSGQTVTRDFTGSLPYAAPEQLAARADTLDGRADVYALAATLYEALTGRLPITGSNLEQLLHEDPTPPRRWNPALSLDLEVVLLKALAKQPARRYADAAAFAADLEAVLALRPIAARPPGRVERARRWARRRPRAAAALLSAAVAVVLFAGYLVYRDYAAAAADREEAARLVERARERLTEYRARQEGLASLEARLTELKRLEAARFLAPDEDAVLDRGRSDIAGARRDREAAAHEVLQLLRRAERLDPGARVDAVRTDLYMQRWRDARAVGDPEAERFYRELVLAHDDEARHRDEIEARVVFTLRTDPPDAAVYLFRLVEQAEVVPDGERRLVPVPWGDETELPRPPGSVALRIVRAVEGWRTGDLVLERGERALVWRNGKAERVVLPGGLEFRQTAIPLFASERCRLEGTRHEVPAGRWLLDVRHPDRLDQRLAFDSAQGRVWEVDVKLPVRARPGFVHVHGWSIPDFWMMEREVTAAEYLAFLNDPDTRRRIDAAKQPILYPREQSEKGVSSYWPRDDDGRFELADDWRSNYPVVGIAWEDARAYAAWRAAREPGRFRLPTYKEWIRAGNSMSLAHYPFGNHWRPKWVSSCYSRRAPDLEPVMGYPIDESPCGVFDMCGSAAEWLSDWYDEDRGTRHLVGGSWAHAKPADFELYGRGTRPELTLGTAGFRLVLEEDAR